MPERPLAVLRRARALWRGAVSAGENLKVRKLFETALVVTLIAGLCRLGNSRSGALGDLPERTTSNASRTWPVTPGAVLARLHVAAAPGGSLRARAPALSFWALPSVGLFLVVLFTWTGPFGHRMNLSGDDSHLYYLDPSAWLRNAPLTTLDGGLLGYNCRVYLVPFLLVLRGIQATGLNVQGAALGLLVALGWAGATALVLVAVGRRDRSARIGAATAGLVAVLAPTVALTQYLQLLLGTYWIALLPWLLVLVIRHQQTGRHRYLVAALLALTLGAPAVGQAPWTIAMAPMLVGAFAVLAWGGVFRLAPRRLAVFVAVAGLANAWWLLPTGLALAGAQANARAATTAAGAGEAYTIVRTLAPLQSPADALALRQSHLQQVAFSSVTLGADSFSRRLWPLGLVPAATIVAGLVLAVVRRRADQNLLLGCVGLLIFNLFFITVRLFGLGAGLTIYRFLLRVVPPFAGVRNFYDRFAIPFALAMAMAFGVALAGVLAGARGRVQTAAAVLLAGGLLLYGYPGLVGQPVHLPYYAGSPENRMANGLPSGYLAMLKRLDREPPGAVLTLPLLQPAWTTVSEPTSDGAYLGISPLLYLTGRTDYNGLDAFGSTSAPLLKQTVADVVRAGDAEALAAIVSELAVQWIVVQVDAGPNRAAARLEVQTDPATAARFQTAFLEEVAPKVIGTFGTFELRRTREDVRRPLIGVAPASTLDQAASYLTDRAAGALVPTGPCRYADVALRRADRSGTHFEADVTSASGCALLVRNAFDVAWAARATVDGRQVPLVHRRALGFANGWELPPGATHVVVDYQRQRLLARSAALSATLVPITAGWGLWRRRRRRSIAARGDR